MEEILKMLNALTADELDSVIMRAGIMLEKKRKEEAEEALREKERQRQEKIKQEQERKRKIEQLQYELRELQRQSAPEIDAVQGQDFVMYDQPKAQAPAQSAAPQPQAAQMVPCPHCHQMNVIGRQYCANCGQKMTAAYQPAPQPQPAYQPQPTPQPQPAPQPQAVAAQVRYADETMKKWEMLPGELTQRGRHEIVLLQPNGGKFAYSMEVTNRRILLYRESAASRNVGMVGRMGGGLLGSMIVEGVKAASGAGPRPWVEIPMAAITNYGLQSKKEYFIVADQTYVIKNKGYEKYLTDIITNSKRNAH